MWENLKTNYLINQKGQAILELATFGSVVLFCLALLVHFGLQMNYQQNAQMQAFRKSLKLAFYKQGPNSQAGFTLVKDKPAIDPRDKWGFADRAPVASGASITWSNTLNGAYVNEFTEDPDYRDMPRTYTEVNKKTAADTAQVNDGMGLADSEINDNLDKNNVGTKAKGTFTTSGWRRTNNLVDPANGLPITKFGVYLEDPQHLLGANDYSPIELTPQDIKVFEDPSNPQQKSAAYMLSGLKRTLDSVVLIHNAAELQNFRAGKSRAAGIIAVKGTFGNSCGDDNYCGPLQDILYVDSSAGELDSYYVDIKPWDGNSDTTKTLQNKQGLLMDSGKTIDYGSGASMTTTETSTGISTKTESAATQTVTHKIRLNDGTVTNVPVTFKPTQAYNYEVSHE